MPSRSVRWMGGMVAWAIALALACGEALAIENVDIVFVIDSSGSMSRVDPQGYRLVLVKALGAFACGVPGDRLAVVQFAGWNELLSPLEGAPERPLVVFPLTEIPEAEDAKKAFFASLEKASKDLVVFGSGTDVSLAFRALGEATGLFAVDENGSTVIIGEPAEMRQVWAIFITDGEIDAVGSGVNLWKNYVELAQEEFGKARRAEIGKAADKFLAEKTLPPLAELKICYSPVSLAPGGASEGGLLDRLAKGGHPPTEPIDVKGSVLADVFRPLVLKRPGLAEGVLSVYGYEQSVLGPGERQERQLHVLRGASRTQIVVFAGLDPESEAALGYAEEVGRAAETGEAAVAPDVSFDASFLNTSNIPDFDKGQVRVSGEGDRYRVIAVAGAPPGVYTLALSNASTYEGAGAPLLVESAIFTEFGFNLVVEGGEAGVYPVGAVIPFSVSCRGPDGHVIDEGFLLQATKAGVNVVGPEPYHEEPSIELQPDRAEGSWEFHATQDKPAGPYELTFYAQAEFGEHQRFVAKPVLVKFAIRPSLAVNFSKAEALLGEVVEVRSEETPKAFELDSFSVDIRAPGAKAKPLTLVYNEERGCYLAEVQLERLGEFSLKAPKREDLAMDMVIQLLDPLKVTAKPRALRVLGEDGAELEELAFNIRCMEKGGYELQAGVELEMALGESLPPFKGLFEPEGFFEKSKSAKAISVAVQVEGAPELPPEPEAPAAEPAEPEGEPPAAEPGEPGAEVEPPVPAEPEEPAAEVEPAEPAEPEVEAEPEAPAAEPEAPAGGADPPAKLTLNIDTEKMLWRALRVRKEWPWEALKIKTRSPIVYAKPGTAVVVAVIPNLHPDRPPVEIRKEMPLRVEFDDFWIKFVRNFWPYIAGAAAVLLLLLYLLLRPKFKMHQIRPIDPRTMCEPRHLLREIHKRKAKVSPEMEGSAVIRRTGLKPFSGTAVLPLEGTVVSVNREEVQRKKKLRHGDEIKLLRGEDRLRYWYFVREPTSEELERMLAADAVVLEEDEVIIEF